MEKKTAVEWFYQRILSKDIKAVFEQAKEMEKEQLESLKDFDVWKEWKNKSE